MHVDNSYSFTIKSSGQSVASLTQTGVLPTGITFTDNGDGTATISGTPVTGSGGAYAITVTAANQLGSASKATTLKVDEGPTITSPDTVTAAIGTAFTFQVTATGYPAPRISKLTALPRGLSWNTAADTITGTPATGTVGTYDIAFAPKNSTGTVNAELTLTVTEQMNSPLAVTARRRPG